MATRTTVPGPYAKIPPHPPGLTETRLRRWSAKNPPVDPHVTFVGKTVLVTGANVGLGYASALKYAQKGASKLILGVRSIEKGKTARQTIVERSVMNEQNILIMQVDLSEWDSVKRFVKELENTVGAKGLDIALLNAGRASAAFDRAPTGYELALQVNALSTTLMGILLLPLLRRTARQNRVPTHLTITSSWGATICQRDWWTDSLVHTLNDDGICFKANGIDAVRHYCLIKLLGISGMKRIASAALGSDGQPEVIVNTVCPFLTKTDLVRDAPLSMWLAMQVTFYFLARTAEEGARSLVGASALEKESHGKLWLHDVLYPMGPLADDEGLMRRLWGEIAEVLAQEEPSIEMILRG